jgi:hypothetical protein
MVTRSRVGLQAVTARPVVLHFSLAVFIRRPPNLLHDDLGARTGDGDQLFRLKTTSRFD